MADAVIAYTGWNTSAGGWGSAAWGQDAALTGLSGAVGSVTVSANADATVTGLEALL